MNNLQGQDNNPLDYDEIPQGKPFNGEAFRLYMMRLQQCSSPKSPSRHISIRVPDKRGIEGINVSHLTAGIPLRVNGLLMMPESLILSIGNPNN